MEPLELLLQGKIMNQKQYNIPRGAGEISATIKDLNAAGVVVPTTSLLNLGTLNFLSASSEDRWIVENDH